MRRHPGRARAQVSPRKMAVMNSKSSRFSSPLTYAFNDSRNTLPLIAPYVAPLGPGFYKGAESHSVNVKEPFRPQYAFKSVTPRLRNDDPNVPSPGQNTASVVHDKASWISHVYTAKGESQRAEQRDGPQLGSFEQLEGLGRAASPPVRSPDVLYSLDLSRQKRPLSKQVLESPQKYSVAFKSSSQRLVPPASETLSLSYPENATDSLALSAMAVSNRQALSLTSSMSGTHSQQPSFEFASVQPRFPPVRECNGPDIDVFQADKKHWSSLGKPTTANSNRFAESEKEEAKEVSPGPGTYINQVQWPSAKPAAEGEALRARRRLFAADGEGGA